MSDKGIIKTNSQELPDKEPRFELIQNDPDNPKSLSSNFIKSMLSDPERSSKYIWVGTDGNGLNRINVSTGDCIHFSTRNSTMPDNVIYEIASGNGNALWVSSNKGLSKFDISTKRFDNYNEEDGLQKMEFNTLSSFKSRKGKLYFGGINGLNSFFPESLNYNLF